MQNKILHHAHIHYYFKIFIVPLSLIFLCAATSPFYFRSLNDTSKRISPSQQNKLLDAMKAQIDDTDTPTPIETETPTPTNIESDTPIPTSTDSETPTGTSTETQTETPVLTPTDTPTPSPTIETQELTPTLCEGTECPTQTATEEEIIFPEFVLADSQNRMSVNQEPTPTKDPASFPIQCQGAEVVAELSGESDFNGGGVMNLGDLTGDGKPEIAASANGVDPNYIEWYVFNGDGYGLYGWIYYNISPLYDSRDVTGLGDIYKNDEVGEWALYSLTHGNIWVFSDWGGAGWQIVQTLGVPHWTGGGYAFKSIGDVNGDGLPDLAVIINTILNVFSGDYPYPELYTIPLNNYPRGLASFDDVDGDGKRDYAISLANPLANPPNNTGFVSIISGATGMEIRRIQGLAGDTYFGTSLTAIGDADGDGGPDLLIGVTGSTKQSVRQYSLRTGVGPVLIREITGGNQTTEAGDAINDGNTDWLLKQYISTSRHNEVSLMSAQGQELARCVPVAGQDLGGMSVAADSDGDGKTEFAIGVPTAKKVYVLEYKPPPVELVSPLNWVMAQSLRPTYQWKPASGADSYLLRIYPVDAQGNALETAPEKIKNVILPANEVCPPTSETCSFRASVNQKNLELASGTTLDKGGYAWKVFSEDANSNIINSSEYGYFQIPSLGGTWEEAVAAGLCNDANCIREDNDKTKIKANPTWNDYDDMIYIEAEREDVPPAILKAIMIGETVYAIAPIPIGSTTFPPHEAYGYEPKEDCEFFVKHTHDNVFNAELLKDFSINIWGKGENPPWDTTCQGGGDCTAPYDLDGMNLVMSIYDFAIGRDFHIANINNFINDEIPGCYTHDNTAQYRTSAGYGLGMITYIHEYLDLSDHTEEYYGSAAPEHVPPEYLYDPQFNIFLMGHVLNDKRCTCNDPISAYTNTNLDDWLKPVSSYNGWGNYPYGKKAIRRAKNYTSPKTLIPGVNKFLREYTTHIDDPWMDTRTGPNAPCPQYNGDTVNTTAIKPLVHDIDYMQSGNSDYQIISTKLVDMKGDLGTVRVDLLIEKTEVYIGLIKIYRDEGGTDLLWQSEPISDISPAIWIDTVDYNGTTVILTYWGDGAHATRVYPIIWDGISFQEVAARDENGTPVFIGGDGGAIIPYAEGYLAAYWRNITPSANSHEAIIWAFDGSGYRIVRRFISPPIGSDQIAPESSITGTGESGANGWYKSGVEVVITATDNQAVKSIYYSIKNGMMTEEKTIPMDRLTIPLYEGRWEIKYQAVDASDNQGEAYTEQVLIDGTPPSVEHRIVGVSGQQGWYTGGTNLILDASDPNLADGSLGSGVAKIEYRLDGSAEWLTYIDPLSIIGSGNHRVEFHGVDNAGNIGEPQSVDIPIDQEGPSITITSPLAQNYSHSSQTMIEWSAMDTISGVASESGTLDGISVANGQVLNINTLSLGIHHLEVTSTDQAGNSTTAAVDFIVVADQTTDELYLHGSGGSANPTTLFLDDIPPTGTSSKYRDSLGVNFNGGNPWKEIGTWTSNLLLSGFVPDSFRSWIGLKNSDDQGTNFDLRVEAYRNGTLVASGESYCITGVTRNPSLAKEVVVALVPISGAGTNGTLSLMVFVRVGTNGSGVFCGGHRNAVGLRMYFDSSDRISHLVMKSGST